jgi:hypothetical protein
VDGNLQARTGKDRIARAAQGDLSWIIARRCDDLNRFEFDERIFFSRKEKER